MPLRRREQPTQVSRGSLIASASRIRLNETNWRAYRLRDEQWQMEAWRFYNEIGEFRFAANYVGSAVSRVRLYVAEIDDVGRIGNEVEDNDEIQAIADTLFGNEGAKAEQLRSIGVNLTVAGECYLIGRSGVDVGDDDTWFVVAPSELRRLEGNMVFRFNGEQVRLRRGRDIVTRLWTPHPARPDLADSPARPALPILAQLEQLGLYIDSQLSSRLSGAGLLPIPNNIDFPRGDDDPPGVEGLMQALMEAGTASRTGQGGAAGVFPILVEMPIEAIEAMPDKPITFESILSEQALAMQQDAIRRLATSLDMPPEVLAGAAETNHWGMWYVEENAVKIHIVPLMVRIVEGLNSAYLAPALRALGEDPKRYTLWFDTAPLTIRPNKLQDTLNLYERGITSREEVLRAGDYNPTTAAPDQEEENIRFIKELMLRDPGLFASAPLREAIGIHIDTVTPQIEGEVSDTPPPPPPAPERNVEEDTSPTPQLPSRTRSQNQTQQNLLSDAGLRPEPSALLVASDILVTEALRKVGKKLLGNRALRGQFRDVPEERIHTKLKVPESEADQLLHGVWSEYLARNYLDGIHVDFAVVAKVLYSYIQGLLVESMTHDRSTLAMMLRSGGLEE